MSKTGFCDHILGKVKVAEKKEKNSAGWDLGLLLIRLTVYSPGVVTRFNLIKVLALVNTS